MFDKSNKILFVDKLSNYDLYLKSSSHNYFKNC